MESDPIGFSAGLGQALKVSGFGGGLRELFGDDFDEVLEDGFEVAARGFGLRQGSIEHKGVEVGMVDGELEVGFGAAPPAGGGSECGGVGAGLVEQAEGLPNDGELEVVEAGEVGVEGHGAKAQSSGDGAGGEGVNPFAVDQIEGGLDDPLPSPVVIGGCPLSPGGFGRLGGHRG